MLLANKSLGYKFETLSLIPDTWAATSRETIENRENEAVNNHAQYCSVVKTGIGKTKMIIGGEVDAGEFCAQTAVAFSTDFYKSGTANLTTRTIRSTGSSSKPPLALVTTKTC